MQHIKNAFKLRMMSFILMLGTLVSVKTSRAEAAAEKKDKKSLSVSPALPVTAADLSSTKKTATMDEVVVTGKQDENSYKADKVSSVKYAGPLRDTPQTIAVVNENVMREQGVTTLRQALNNVPGISMQAGEGGVPAGDNLTIRGFSARTDISVDNVRDFAGYTRDAFNFEQVEVVKGPASSYTGRGSTGGTVNMASKKPHLDPRYKGTVSWGTEDYKRLTLDLNQPLRLNDKAGLDGAAFRLNTMLHDQNISGRDYVENQRWGIAPSLAFGLETDTRLTVSYFHLQQDNVPDYGLPWVPGTGTTQNNALRAYREQKGPADFHNFYGLLDRDYEKVRTDVYTLEAEHDVNEHLTLRDLFRFGRTNRDSVITAPRFVGNNSTAINRQVQSRDMVDTIMINQLDALWKFAVWNFEHAAVTGVELVRETSQNHLRAQNVNSPTADYMNPNPRESYNGEVLRTGARNKSWANTVALYGFDTIALSEKFDLIGGLRWDYMDTDYRMTDTRGFTQPFQRIDSVLSWRTGLVFKPVEPGSIYFAYGTSTNPSAEGLTLGTATSSTNSVLADPEKSRTAELGTKWDVIKERLALTSAIFRTDKVNARTPDPIEGLVVVNRGKQRVDGIEFAASGNVTDDWAIFAAYTILKSEIRSSKTPGEEGRHLSNTPGHSFNIWSTYQLPFNFEIGGGFRFIDRRYANNTNTRKAPSYMILDAMLAYKATDNVTIRLNAQNLTDKEYIDSLGGGHFIPGQGRSAIVSTEFQF